MIPGRQLKSTKAIMSIKKKTTGDLILLMSEINKNLFSSTEMK